jgi:hypothetical protein
MRSGEEAVESSSETSSWWEVGFREQYEVSMRCESSAELPKSRFTVIAANQQSAPAPEKAWRPFGEKAALMTQSQGPTSSDHLSPPSQSGICRMTSVWAPRWKLPNRHCRWHRRVCTFPHWQTFSDSARIAAKGRPASRLSVTQNAEGVRRRIQSPVLLKSAQTNGREIFVADVLH